MTRLELIDQIRTKESFLCVGLDTDIQRIPKHLLKLDDPVFEFNKAIIDATKDHCVAYKPNTAFYEANGVDGWKSLQKTIDYIPKTHFTIADAKRGDIGNTSSMYAKAFLETMSFDSVTVAPYMGEDSVTPFFKYKDKFVIVLGLTSNKGSQDFQHLKADGKALHEHVLYKVATWGTIDNIMFVVGATQADYLAEIRKTIPDHFLLVPGVGAQGGSLDLVYKYGANADIGLLVNSSRGIIYASEGHDFAEIAGNEAAKLQRQMAHLMKK